MFKANNRNTIFSSWIWGVVLTTLGLFLGFRADAVQSAALAWNSETNAGTIGYHVYYGTNSESYVSRLDAGTNSHMTIDNLTEGTTYYFVVTAYSISSGAESTPTPEVAYLSPGLLTPMPHQNPNQSLSMRFSALPGYWYEVQASTNCVSWATIWQMGTVGGNSWIGCSDPLSSSFPNRYYRLAGHLSSVLPPPTLVSMNQSGALVRLTWNAAAGQKYQIQYAWTAYPNNWLNLGSVVTASGPTAMATEVVDPKLQWFYRVVLAHH